MNGSPFESRIIYLSNGVSCTILSPFWNEQSVGKDLKVGKIS